MHERRHQRKATATELIRRTEIAVRPQPLVAQNRMSVLAFVAVSILFGLVLLLFFQVRGFVGNAETRQAEFAADDRLRTMNQQMDVLRGRFNGLLAESIESRLRLLQKNLDAGKASPDDIRTFADLQRDLSLLETYAGRGDPVPAPESFEHTRYQPVAVAAPRVVRNDELLDEVRQLKLLLYVCAVAVAVGLLVIAGLYWLRQRRHRPAIEAPVEPLTRLAAPPFRED